MKIPNEYGGLGFTVASTASVMQMVGATTATSSALLSAHQSIGVAAAAEALRDPGAEKKYLPRCAAGAISPSR
jgi:alkylation response protein AidB-like acyl-CoA dehydrogenase